MDYIQVLTLASIFGGAAFGMSVGNNAMLRAFQSEIVLMKDLNPFHRMNSNASSGVIFYLYTRSGPEEILRLDQGDLMRSHFDVHKGTKIIIHGYFDNKKKPMPQAIKNNYLATQDVNVIIVDWGKIAIGIDYVWIAEQVPQVGQYLSQLIDFLILNGCKPSSFHLIGHSLGAHIAGIAGSSLKNGKLARITGLDPAKPLFERFLASDRLDRNDADFVDCIHTCGGLLGIYQPLGHVDFYPNGGRNVQPGCKIYDFGRCSHVRSHQYFAESIFQNHIFPALKCDTENFNLKNCTETEEKMGNFVNHRSRGIFLAHTNREAPFAPIRQ